MLCVPAGKELLKHDAVRDVAMEGYAWRRQTISNYGYPLADPRESGITSIRSTGGLNAIINWATLAQQFKANTQRQHTCLL